MAIRLSDWNPKIHQNHYGDYKNLSLQLLRTLVFGQFFSASIGTTIENVEYVCVICSSQNSIADVAVVAAKNKSHSTEIVLLHSKIEWSWKAYMSDKRI